MIRVGLRAIRQARGVGPAIGCVAQLQVLPAEQHGRSFCSDDASAGNPPAKVAAVGPGKAKVAAAASTRPRLKRLKRKEVFGSHGRELEEDPDLQQMEESITHLYDPRGIVDKWMGHPTFWGMLSEDAIGKGEVSDAGPPGEGPILRWQTRIVLGPGGDGFHPANRKVSVAVYVKELGLSQPAITRLLALVGKRYNPNKDELTITSERYEHREENRKDVLRTLVAVIKEANNADHLVAQDVASKSSSEVSIEA